MTDRTVLGLFSLVVLAASAAVIVPLERHYAHDPVEQARRGEVTGLSRLSLLRAANARQALQAVARRSPAGALVQDFRLEATAIVLNVEDPAKGTVQTFEVHPGIAVDTGGTTDASADYGVAFAALDGAIPERMARTVLARVHRPASALDYVTLSISPGGPAPQWVLYLRHGPVGDRGWVAKADGTGVRRLGT